MKKPDTSKYYNAGSAAPKIDTWEYPIYPQVFPQKQHKVRPKTEHNKQKSKQQVKEQLLYHLKFLFTSIIVLSSCMVMVLFNSIITEQKRNINQLNKTLQNLKEENSEFEIDIVSTIDLQYIEEEAIRLGMSKPANHQIIHIDVPKSNHTISNTLTQEIQSSTDVKFTQYVREFFKRIFG